MRTKQMRYKCWHAVYPTEMFLRFKTSTLKTRTFAGVAGKTTGSQRVEGCARVFSHIMEVIVDDVIENGVQFKFMQLKGRENSLSLEPIRGEEFLLARKRYALGRVDPLDSNFTGLRLMYKVVDANGVRTSIPVKVDTPRMERMDELANTQKYKNGPAKNYKDYLKQIYEMFPQVDRLDINRIMSFGFTAIARYLKYGCDVLVSKRGFFIYFGYSFKRNRDMARYMVRKLKTKARIMYRLLSMMWDGWCWFALKRERYEELKEALENHEEIDFGDVVMHKTYDDALFNNYGYGAILKVRIEGFEFDNRWFTKHVSGFKSSECIVDDVISYDDWYNPIKLCRNVRHYQVMGVDHRKAYGTLLRNQRAYDEAHGRKPDHKHISY